MFNYNKIISHLKIKVLKLIKLKYIVTKYGKTSLDKRLTKTLLIYYFSRTQLQLTSIGISASLLLPLFFLKALMKKSSANIL